MICDSCREKEHHLCINFGFFGEVARNSCFCQHNTKLGEASRGAQAAYRSAETRAKPSKVRKTDGVQAVGTPPADGRSEGEESPSRGDIRVHQEAEPVPTARVWELPEDILS